MDDKWFKQQQKRVGVTADDIAQKMGRTRANVSNIYTGRQKMSLDWAQAFADVLKVPLDEVLRRSGSIEEKPARDLAIGFAEGDAAQWTGRSERTAAVARTFGNDRPGIDVWTVATAALNLGGYLPGDHILVDTHQSETCRAGDIVLAQKYDRKLGTAVTVLRRFEPPVLVSATANTNEQRVLIVDGENVIIKGKIIASWRAT